MPFAGDRAAGQEALAALSSLRTLPGDELILVDNSGVLEGGPGGVEILAATGERSPAHARNAGAARARRDWILFIDSDCEPPPDLLDAYFEQPVGGDVGAIAGEVLSAPGTRTLIERYGAARGFLSQRAHLDHPYRPRAAAANLMVRRAAFEAVAGFYEGVRAAEDTDFSWRLQQASWRLELRPEAYVHHRYRTSLHDLRRQWRGYAAGRAWLARRYEGFTPEPGAARALKRLRRAKGSDARRSAPASHPGPLERGTFAALDALLAAEELAGLALSNRPPRQVRERFGEPDVVLVAERFPARGDPLVELAQTIGHARVEALRRPESLDPESARGLEVDYVEDDGTAAQLAAAASVWARHPVRAALDLIRPHPGQPTLSELAPAVRRLEHDRRARIQALGSGKSAALAERLARLTGRRVDR